MDKMRSGIERATNGHLRQRILDMARFNPASDNGSSAKEHNPLDSPLYGCKVPMRDEQGEEYNLGFYVNMNTRAAEVILYAGDSEVLVVSVPEDLHEEDMSFDADLLEVDWSVRLDAVADLIWSAELEIGIRSE